MGSRVEMNLKPHSIMKTKLNRYCKLAATLRLGKDS